MFDQSFLSSKSGLAALVSIAAMVTFNFFAIAHQAGFAPDLLVVAVPMMELA